MVIRHLIFLLAFLSSTTRYILHTKTADVCHIASEIEVYHTIIPGPNMVTIIRNRVVTMSLSEAVGDDRGCRTLSDLA